MKISKDFYLSVSGILISAALCFSACGSDENTSSAAQINTATVTAATTVETAATSDTSAPLESSVSTSADTEPVTTSTSASTANEPAVSDLSKAQLEEVTAQQMRQLKALAIGNKSRYLEQMHSGELFAALYGKGGEKLSGKKLTEKIAATEDEYFRLNYLAFADMEIEEIIGLSCSEVKETTLADGIKEYKLTYTAMTDTAKIGMEGTVLEINGKLLSAATVAEGMIP